MYTPIDYEMMSRAIHLARNGLYTSMPNPRVGCVLTKSGRIIGEGWHFAAGENHAEINALKKANNQAAGAAAYITLEPCSHYGKTPPCAAALVEAGIQQAVVGMVDPNPCVSGKGIAMLENAGISVRVGLMEEEVHALNPGFIKRMRTGLPFVRCKLAMSVDGRTAMASGDSKWITGADARADVQRLRARSCAVISGIESVLEDDPSLTVRYDEADMQGRMSTDRQPLRVILDSRLRISPKARLFDGKGRILIVCAEVEESIRQQLLNTVNEDLKDKNAEADQVEVLALPDGKGRVHLPAVLQTLGDRGYNEVLLETGAILAGSALESNLIDQLWIYMAPVLLGSDARELFNLPLTAMKQKVPLNIQDIRSIGADWRFIITM